MKGFTLFLVFLLGVVTLLTYVEERYKRVECTEVAASFGTESYYSMTLGCVLLRDQER